LHYAHDADAARALILAGADAGARSALGETPLFHKYRAETVRALIQSGADPNARDASGNTPLFSAYSGAAVRTLVEGGADVDALNADSLSPLETAFNNEHEDVALALLSLDARLPPERTRRTNLIERARDMNWNDVLPILVERAKRETGRRPDRRFPARRHEGPVGPASAELPFCM
jgi:ankyrin repeat protein